MTLPTMADKTVRLVSFLGTVNNCQVSTKTGGMDKNTYTEITWSKDPYKTGEPVSVNFFVYDRMSNRKEVDNILEQAQLQLDTMFGEDEI